MNIKDSLIQTSVRQNVDSVILQTLNKPVSSVTLSSDAAVPRNDDTNIKDSLANAPDTLSQQNVSKSKSYQDTTTIVRNEVDVSKRNFVKPDTSSQSITTSTLYDTIGNVSFDRTSPSTFQRMQEVISVENREKGIPVPRIPRTDNGVVIILLGCFFLSAFVIARSKRFLFQQIKDFITHRERFSIFVTSGVTDMRYLILLVLQTCVLTGFCIFSYISSELPEFAERSFSLSLFGIYICVCLVYLLFKWILYSFLGWVFFDTVKTNVWIECYSTLTYWVGFALLPCVLFLVYLDLSTVFIVVTGIILIGTVEILIFYKWVKLFLGNLSNILLLILYFCAIEITPFFLLYEGIIRLNNVLLINS
ncbi:hypothetical protein EZS27_018897 [termite gut metagenome]|uniref:DUF4271 domain-containing protein n=1 Tax=termite gut metagenome TaxID=433724 RepID=A0A5J4RIF6_9ZZZZ